MYRQGQTTYGLNYASRQGVRGAGEWNLGWGWNTPTESLASAFEPGDPRKDVTLLYAGPVNEPYVESVPPATANVTRQYWNQTVYTNPAFRDATGSQGGQWFTIRVIRSAVVLYMDDTAPHDVGKSDSA